MKTIHDDISVDLRVGSMKELLNSNIPKKNSSKLIA